jgi:hypothetical protein
MTERISLHRIWTTQKPYCALLRTSWLRTDWPNRATGYVLRQFQTHYSILSDPVALFAVALFPYSHPENLFRRVKGDLRFPLTFTYHMDVHAFLSTPLPGCAVRLFLVRCGPVRAAGDTPTPCRHRRVENRSLGREGGIDNGQTRTPLQIGNES